MCNAKGHVRFTPESDIKSDIMECPLRAKRTSGPVGLSAFDDLVGAGKNCRRNGEAESLRSLEVYEEFEFGRLFDRQIGGPFAFENLVNIGAGTSEDCALIGAIGHERARFQCLSRIDDKWKPTLRRCLREMRATLVEQPIRRHHDPIKAIGDDPVKCCLEIS